MQTPKTKILFAILNRHQRRLNGSDIPAAREYFESLSKKRRPVPIATVYEEQVTSDGQKITIRIYESKPNDKPTLVFFHGGGFVVGSINSHDTLARLLCKTTGCSVVSVGYRLAPEYPNPAATDDGLAVIEWLKDATLNQSFILAGDSAGGQIALMVALSVSRESHERMKALLLMYPALDPALKTESMQQFAEGFFVTKKNMADFWNAYIGQGSIIWPLSSDELKTLPPTLIQTAHYDILRDEAHAFFKELQAAGIQTEYHNYKGSTHGLLQMPNIAGSRNKALKAIRTFIDTLQS